MPFSPDAIYKNNIWVEINGQPHFIDIEGGLKLDGYAQIKKELI